MKTLYVIALIIVGTISLAAQERVLTEAEYTDTVSRAEKAVASGPYRLTLANDVTTEGRPETDYHVRSVNLTVPGQGAHLVEDRSFGGKPSKSESITLNGKAFTRDAAGQWKEIQTTSRTASGTVKSPASKTETTNREAIYKYVGTESSQGRNVHVYTKWERRKTLNPETGVTSESETVSKVSIATDGTYFRNEMNTKNSFSGKTGQIKIVIEMQADPSIKITAPLAAQ
jgi:hypothetical protein